MRADGIAPHRAPAKPSACSAAARSIGQRGRVATRPEHGLDPRKFTGSPLNTPPIQRHGGLRSKTRACELNPARTRSQASFQIFTTQVNCPGKMGFWTTEGVTAARPAREQSPVHFARMPLTPNLLCACAVVGIRHREHYPESLPAAAYSPIYCRQPTRVCAAQQGLRVSARAPARLRRAPTESWSDRQQDPPPMAEPLYRNAGRRSPEVAAGWSRSQRTRRPLGRRSIFSRAPPPPEPQSEPEPERMPCSVTVRTTAGQIVMLELCECRR